MKKIFILTALILTAALALAGCSGGTPSLTLETTWGKNFTETAGYEITFEESDDESPTGATFKFTSGEYNVVFNSVKEENSTTYELKTTTKVSGVYTYNGEEKPFEDSIETLARFKGVTQYSLFPTYSEKTVKSTGMVENKGRYELKSYDIKTSTEYDADKKTAKVSLHSKNPETGEYNLPVGELDTARTFKKLGKTSYFDNETILYVIRAMSLKEGFTASFRTIDALSQNLTELGVAVAEKNSLTEESFNVNGESKNVNVLKVSIGINSTMAGAGFEGFYAQSAENQDGARRMLYRLKSPMPYNLGTLVYTLKTYEYQNL